VPMMPVVTSLRRTALEILVYSVVMWVVTIAVGPIAGLGWIYALSATVLGGVFSWMAWRLFVHARVGTADVAEAMKLFHYSISYLTGLFVLMAVDVLVRGH
jgi:heme o synthase